MEIEAATISDLVGVVGRRFIETEVTEVTKYGRRSFEEMRHDGRTEVWMRRQGIKRKRAWY